MNKKIFGIKLGTILMALGCIVVAFVIWVIAKYNISPAESEFVTSALTVRGLKL